MQKHGQKGENTLKEWHKKGNFFQEMVMNNRGKMINTTNNNKLAKKL